MNLLFLIWIFTEVKATVVNVNRKRKQCLRRKIQISKLPKRENGFRLMALEREKPNLFAIVTQFLNAKEFLRLVLGNKRLHETLNGSLESLKRHLNAEFVRNFAIYFVTYAHFSTFPQKEFVLPYFNFFCLRFGTESTKERIWNRDDRNPQTGLFRFVIIWHENKITKLAYFVEKGNVFYADEIAGCLRLYKHQENRVPWIIARKGILEDMDFTLFPPEVQNVGNEFVLKFNFPPEITVVSYLTPENFHASIRNLPFSVFPGFK